MQIEPTRLSVALVTAAWCTVGACPFVATRLTQGSSGSIRYEIVEGSRASFRVREQLVGISFANDVVGMTTAVEATLVIGSDGALDLSQSRITVDLATLSSDQSMRDGFLRRRILDVEQYPQAVFVPRRLGGATVPPEPSGEMPFDIVGFQLIGDMTIHGMTQEITFDVIGTFRGDTVQGKALTSFPFSMFNPTRPRLPFLLSVEDEIRLEIDFKLVKAG
ncbi:MAG: YceI family protein [Acidobacteria bacterium]|nr:YceI family protein [Acidobacteriota bacterium]